MKTLLLLFLLTTTAFAQNNQGQAGVPVDRYGGATIDPTINVNALVASAVKRLDDLRVASDLLSQTKIDDLKEMIALRSKHTEELSKYEAGRLDAIRQVDREEVNKTAATANTAIATLAKQTTDLSTTLAKQVQDTAVATEQRQTLFAGEVNKRLQALELSSSERIGKQQVADPQLERNNALLEKLVQAQSAGQGQWTLLSTLIAFGILVIAGLAFIYRKSSQNGKLLRSK